MVVEEMFPKITLLKGAATEQGFYYDFLCEMAIEPHQLILIEERMRGVIKSDVALEPVTMMRGNAMELFRHRKQHEKVLQIASLTAPTVELVRIDKFFDICPEPLVASTEPLRAFKLLTVEPIVFRTAKERSLGAFRVTGAVDSDPQKLKASLKTFNVLKKCGFNTVVDKFGLFSFQEDIGSLAWCWMPPGLVIKDFLVKLWGDSVTASGYSLVSTPPLIKRSLFRDFREGESPLDLACFHDGADYRIPSSLTPSHLALFWAERHPKFPTRYAECALVSQGINDVSFGGLMPPLAHGDYAHSFCSPEEVRGEIISSLQFIDKIIKMFGFGSHWLVVNRGKKFAGKAAVWDALHGDIVEALRVTGVATEVAGNDNAFLGPRLQGVIIDSLGREWKLPDVALDIATPEKLAIRCRGPGGKEVTPILVTTKIFGTLEKFIGVLIEHYQGEFPHWMHLGQMR
jgi:threonyl-tRNA synthetase